MPTRRAVLGFGGALLLTGCTRTEFIPTPPESAGEPGATDRVTGLDSPWGLALLPDGGALVGSRNSGRILRVADGRADVLTTVPGVATAGEGGLLGLTLAPDGRRLYAYLTAPADNRIVAMSWDGARLGEPEVLLTGIPKAGIHNGGRMIFGPDDRLYVGTGDAGNSARALDRGSLGGKILRLDADGRAASGNPFDSPVWSYGHRNVQGLAFDDDDQLWASEFGASSWDELNRIEAGASYGWPAVEGRGSQAGSIEPQAVWPTGEASPSGLAFWRGSLWMAGLRGQRLWQIPLADGRAGTPRAWYEGTYGRLRTVAAAVDGDSLWLGTSNSDGRGSPRDGDDRLLRVTPG